MARERIAFQGLPARICWVGLGQRHRLGLAFNEMVKNGALEAPIVIGRDHLDSGSVASPNRETEAMLDGSDSFLRSQQPSFWKWAYFAKQNPGPLSRIHISFQYVTAHQQINPQTKNKA